MKSSIQDTHSPHAQNRDRFCCTEYVRKAQLGTPPTRARQMIFVMLLVLPTEKARLSNGKNVSTLLPTALTKLSVSGELRAGFHYLELTALQGDYHISGRTWRQWEWEQLTLRLCFHCQVLASFFLCFLL